MPNDLYTSLFVNCKCEDCRHSEYDSDRAQYYCHVGKRFHDSDDNAPCSNYEE